MHYYVNMWDTNFVERERETERERKRQREGEEREREGSTFFVLYKGKYVLETIKYKNQN